MRNAPHDRAAAQDVYKRQCQSCPLREKCLNKTDKRGARKLEHRYFREAWLKNINRQHEPEYREALKLRQIWCFLLYTSRCV